MYGCNVKMKFEKLNDENKGLVIAFKCGNEAIDEFFLERLLMIHKP